MDTLERKMQRDIDQRDKESGNNQFNSIGGLLVSKIEAAEPSRKAAEEGAESGPTLE